MSAGAVKASMFSVLGFLGVANYFRGLSRTELNASQKLRQVRMESSSQFCNGKVIGRMPKTPYRGSKTYLNVCSFFRRSKLKPNMPLPHAELDIHLLKKRSHAFRITWLGHSSLFLEMNHARILIDPVFNYAAPLIGKPWFSRNLDLPADKKSLPLPDLIVISHDHYDHLEKSTIKYYADKPVRFFVPLGVGLHLENWGIHPDKIHEFDWWESVNVNGINITATPANHNSGRTGFDNDKTLWCSWAFCSGSGSVFFSGDSAYDTHFKEIRQRLGHFDLACIEVAANVKNGQGYPVENCGHMQAYHTLQAFQDLGADKLLPVHWSTFELFTHKWDEPIHDLIAEAEYAGTHLLTPMVGETVYPKLNPETSFWWLEAEDRVNIQSSFSVAQVEFGFQE
ncbi:MBL fold metallo-hydrolase [Vibrio sp. HA2012]|uniref:MBL fold metallo-hydrolase n=1 Tax=Vibrio sp. HA2012 TaxID=1971595 RepID=UPI000C2CC68E|nr:MBL fold metallo-hydrolase [Vibrio sp. HA2012]PJC86878.1 MBL fold metallo-hydrolase [Vibrio sp. HA2012]